MPFVFEEESLDANDRALGQNELTFESRRSRNLPQQNGTPEQDMYQESLPSGKYVFEEEKPSSKTASIGRAAGRGLLDALLDASSMFPVATGRGPASTDILKDLYEQYIGVPEEGVAERFTERAARNLPWLLVGGAGGIAGKVGRGLFSSALGQLAEEAEIGPLGQFIAESIGLGVPSFGKRIQPTKAQKPVVEMLRRRGLTEKEIAPSLTSPSSAQRLKYLAKRTGVTEKRIKRTQEAMGRVYDQLREEGKATPILGSNRSSMLRSSLENIIEDLPEEITKNASAKIEKTFMKPVKAKDLIDLTWKLNQEIFSGKVKNPKKALNALKDPIGKALIEIDPEIGKDFQLLQGNYSNFLRGVSKHLKPDTFTNLLKYGKMGTLVSGILSFNPILVKGVLGTEAARYGFAELLLNPRFKNLTNQMLKAIDTNKVALAKKISDQMKKEVEKSMYTQQKEQE